MQATTRSELPLFRTCSGLFTAAAKYNYWMGSEADNAAIGISLG
jgi:hypothetical protein